MKIQYILHADFETPGVIQTWASEKGFIESFSRPFSGEVLNQHVQCDLLVIMGGPQSPLDLQNAPYLKEEITFIKKAIQTQIPILGFCLGAQLIGEALGAKTERSPYKEVGVYPIELTQEGRQDPLLEEIPSSFSVVHWHNDMPGLTSEAKVLGFSKGCPRQIIRYLPFVYGFQCHPEPTQENIKTMINCCPNDLTPGKFVQSSQEFLAQDFNAINNIMFQILNNLLKKITHKKKD